MQHRPRVLGFVTSVPLPHNRATGAGGILDPHRDRIPFHPSALSRPVRLHRPNFRRDSQTTIRKLPARALIRKSHVRWQRVVIIHYRCRKFAPKRPALICFRHGHAAKVSRRDHFHLPSPFLLFDALHIERSLIFVPPLYYLSDPFVTPHRPSFRVPRDHRPVSKNLQTVRRFVSPRSRSSLLFLFFHQCDRIQTLKRNSADRVPIQIHLSIPLGRYFINSVRRLFHDAYVLRSNQPFRSRSLDVHQLTLRASRHRRNNRSTVCFDALKTTTLITRGRYRR
mmetsp:Transcript_7245/g.22565  ORF Transcript_7245/g.22565 Transcript_7245/m.22565 type:complete len:281 (-) Transcript_7245:271-1113(-)